VVLIKFLPLLGEQSFLVQDNFSFLSKMVLMCLLAFSSSVSVSSCIILSLVEVGKGDLAWDPSDIWAWIWCLGMAHLHFLSDWRIVWNMETDLTIVMDLTLSTMMMVAMLG
jgi:hypothetical protein